eukprot:301309-Amphidinium_carterae.1
MDVVPFLRPWQGIALVSLSRSPYEVTRARAEVLSKICRMKMELQKREECLHNTMPFHVRQVVKGKAILLFSELLRECGIDPAFIEAGLSRGFDLTGVIPQTGFFPARSVLVEPIDRGQMLSESSWRVPAAMASFC